MRVSINCFNNCEGVGGGSERGERSRNMCSNRGMLRSTKYMPQSRLRERRDRYAGGRLLCSLPLTMF